MSLFDWLTKICTWPLYKIDRIDLFTYFRFFRFIPDSPRWLIKKGRTRETIEILIEAAKMNKRTALLPYDLEEQIKVYSINKLKLCQHIVFGKKNDFLLHIQYNRIISNFVLLNVYF